MSLAMALASPVICQSPHLRGIGCKRLWQSVELRVRDSEKTTEGSEALPLWIRHVCQVMCECMNQDLPRPTTRKLVTNSLPI